jgi:xanthosine utilization system XapX-like protein
MNPIQKYVFQIGLMAFVCAVGLLFSLIIVPVKVPFVLWFLVILTGITIAFKLTGVIALYNNEKGLPMNAYQRWLLAPSKIPHSPGWIPVIVICGLYGILNLIFG